MFHVFYDDAGVGNHSLGDLQTQVDTMNAALAGSDITLYLRGVNRIQDNDIFHNQNGLSAAKQANYVDTKNVLNAWLVKRSGGYSSFPGPNSGGASDGITLSFITIPGNPWHSDTLWYANPLGQPNEGGTFVHEVGHWLGLYHTFGTGNSPPSSCPDASYPACLSNGDRVCDTPPDTLNSNMPGDTCWMQNSCPDALGPGGSDAPDDIHNYMDYSLDFCWTRFTQGQFDRMRAMVAAYRPGLVNGDGATVHYDRSVTIQVNQEWEWYGTDVHFPAGKGVTVIGKLKAESSTFTEATTGGGWGGISVGGSTFARGIPTAEFTDSVIERVKADASVKAPAAVWVYNADATFTGSIIQDNTSAGSYSVAGLRVSGANASVVVQQESEISDNGGSGLIASNDAEVMVSESRIRFNEGSGVEAHTGARVELPWSVVFDNDDYGVAAYDYGEVWLDEFAAPASVTATTTVEGNDGGGLYAEGGGLIEAGVYAFQGGSGMCLYACNNRILNHVSGVAPFDAKAVKYSNINAEYDWWGVTSVNDLVLIEESGVISVEPLRPNDPGTGLRDGGTLVAARGVGESSANRSDTRELLHQARQAAAVGEYVQAFTLLREVIQTADDPDYRRIGYTEATRLLRRAQPPQVLAFLEGVEDGSYRPWALRALVFAYEAQGRLSDAATVAATLVEDYGSTPHARFGYTTQFQLRLQQDDLAGADVVVSAAEAQWPEHRTVVAARALLDRLEGGSEGARGILPFLAGSEGERQTALQVESVELSAPYPNPADGTVTVPLALSEAADVRLAVYDVRGREVLVLRGGWMERGRHTEMFETSVLPSGVYVVQARVVSEAGAVRALSQKLVITR